MWFRDLATKKIRGDVFGEIRIAVLEKNGKDEILRESNPRTYRREEEVSK